MHDTVTPRWNRTGQCRARVHRHFKNLQKKPSKMFGREDERNDDPKDCTKKTSMVKKILAM